MDQPQREQWELTAAEWEKAHARDRRLEREAIEKVDRLKRQPRPKSVSANLRYLEKISAAEKVLREASESADRWGGEAVRKEVVRRAYESGKPVPSAILAESPDIASNAKPQQSADMADVPETDFGKKKAAQPSASKATPEKPAGVATSGQRQEAPLLDKFTDDHLKKWVEDKIVAEDQDRYLAGIKAYLAKNKEVIDRGYSWSKVRDLAEQWGFVEQATPQAAAKEPWQMTSDEFSAQELEADEYRDQIEGSAEDLRDFRQNTDLAWRRSVESRAEVGRVPDAVLDDYIEKYGEDTFSSMFRGVAEKGRAGYVLPKNRGQGGFTPVAKKYVSDLKPHERTWDQQRTAIKQGMPRKLSLAEWK